MARAIAECTCATCGAKFERIQFRPNRKMADEWKEWAEENCTVCPDCWQKEKPPSGLFTSSAKRVTSLMRLSTPDAPSSIQTAEKNVWMLEKVLTKSLICCILTSYAHDAQKGGRNMEQQEKKNRYNGKRPLNIVMGDKQIDALEAAAQKRSISKSALLRIIITDWMEANEKQEARDK